MHEKVRGQVSSRKLSLAHRSLLMSSLYIITSLFSCSLQMHDDESPCIFHQAAHNDVEKED
jgi:hypothetical protein